MGSVVKSLSSARKTATGVSSGSSAEAKRRALDFFRDVCRNLPVIMERYNLDEVITLAELRSKIAADFRKHQTVSNPLVIDMLVYKGEEQLQYCLDHAKQRHHLISEYVVPREGSVNPSKLGVIDRGESQFLKAFYQSNNSL